MGNFSAYIIFTFCGDAWDNEEADGGHLMCYSTNGMYLMWSALFLLTRREFFMSKKKQTNKQTKKYKQKNYASPEQVALTRGHPSKRATILLQKV